MKQTEQQVQDRCPGCGRAILLGSILGVLADLEQGKTHRKVYGLHPAVSAEESDACYVGCVIEDDMRCPACGSGILYAVEVEYSDTCELCGGTPSGREWYWDDKLQRYVGLCEQCKGSERGEAWVESR